MVLEKAEQSLRVSTYLDFKKQYDNSQSNVQTLLSPAKQFVSHLDQSKVSEIMEQPYNIVKKLESETGLEQSLKKMCNWRIMKTHQMNRYLKSIG
jgi:hypothetical protein